MEFLPAISLIKAFPVAQICPNLHKIVPSSVASISNSEIVVSVGECEREGQE